MNAAIKIGNLHHLQVLQQLLFAKIMVKDDRIATVKLPFYNFINLVISILDNYTKNSNEIPLNVFILNHFLVQHGSPFEVYRHMHGFIAMWKKYLEAHQQARIILSLLSSERNSRESVKLFLKIRKAILRNLNSKIMQEITLNHQDIIAISHTIFSSEMKSYASKKIHELFISIKKKTLYSNNKINGAVVCQFFMNCAQKFQKQDFQNLREYLQNAPAQKKQIIIKQRTFKPLKADLMFQYSDNEEHQQIAQEQNIQHFKKYQDSPKKLINNNFILNNLFEISPKKQIDPLQNAKDIVNKKYSYSWQKFLKTNQQMKEKLLKNHQQNV